MEEIGYTCGTLPKYTFDTWKRIYHDYNNVIDREMYFMLIGMQVSLAWVDLGKWDEFALDSIAEYLDSERLNLTADDIYDISLEINKASKIICGKLRMKGIVTDTIRTCEIKWRMYHVEYDKW